MTDTLQTATRLNLLRHKMRDAGMTHFIVPKADAFQNESVPAWEDRLAWLTGFTGSAGTCIVMADRAVLAVDSRYTLQARAQTDPASVEVHSEPDATLEKTVSALCKPGDLVGYDPQLTTLTLYRALRHASSEHSFRLKGAETNPIDALWTGRPAVHFVPVFPHPEHYSGEGSAEKLRRVQAAVAGKNCDGLLISAPDAVAWLFNLRGGDVAHAPLPLMRAFVPVQGRPLAFVQDGHVTDGNREWLTSVTDIAPLSEMTAALAERVKPEARILLDTSATVALRGAIEAAGGKAIRGDDPCRALKAVKNATELEGARNAHKRDAVAMCQFLHWLDGAAGKNGLDELGAAAKLEAFRRSLDLFHGLSFDTIAGAGPNGAIVHYRVTRQTNRPLQQNSLFLIDSGGQFLDGTTDITRTVAIGTPTAAMRRHFTLVLKGHIAIATARFPKGTRGADIDAFARRALWEAGLDYGHGTGHGVGSFLSVHEYPPSISKRGTAVLEPGMIVSNEPGYYREGEYGIRIENLLAVTEPSAINGGDKPMLGFETLTLVPIDRRLIDVALLSQTERAWLDGYHASVRATVAPLLSEPVTAWLHDATEPLQTP
jgi:Xaa-Pro aminopeptidase